MNKRQKKKHGLLYSQRLGKKLDQLRIELKEVAARASALVDENASLRRTVKELEHYVIEIDLAKFDSFLARAVCHSISRKTDTELQAGMAATAKT